jgi:predicted nuclease of predicted toxin-antitoxin system
LPFDAADLLRGLGHDVETVVSEGLAGRPDVDVIAAASAESRFLMNLDRGMGDIRAYPPGTHPGIAVFRLSDQSPDRAVIAIKSFAENQALDDLSGCLVIVREHLVRVRRPS